MFTSHSHLILLRNKCECDVNISDNNSQTPLHIACYTGNVALVEILLRNKCECDVSISDNNSQTKLSHWSRTHLFLTNISTSATFPV
jgi:ankyrin repeat protein